MDAPFHGIFTPLITPLDAEGAPDLPTLDRLVRFQLRHGVQGFWAMGTSGEFASFDGDERTAVIEAIVRASGGAPVIANVSDASTRLALRHAKSAVAAGAAAIAATPPYYYPHSQDELLAHYRSIREAVDLPLLIYNIPQTVRTRVDLETASTLARQGTVAGIKDSQNDLEWLRQLALCVRRHRLTFSLFAGTRFLIDAAVQCGATGVIPNIANAFPDLCIAVYDAALAGDFERSSRLEATIVDLEAIAGQAGGGSRHAATLGFLKSVLRARGIIDRADLTGPLRTPTRDEQEGAAEAVAAIDVSVPSVTRTL